MYQTTYFTLGLQYLNHLRNCRVNLKLLFRPLLKTHPKLMILKLHSRTMILGKSWLIERNLGRRLCVEIKIQNQRKDARSLNLAIYVTALHNNINHIKCKYYNFTHCIISNKCFKKDYDIYNVQAPAYNVLYY